MPIRYIVLIFDPRPLDANSSPTEKQVQGYCDISGLHYPSSPIVTEISCNLTIDKIRSH